MGLAHKENSLGVRGVRQQKGLGSAAVVYVDETILMLAFFVT